VQPDVALAQAGTLREWAEQWERNAQPHEGAGEAAFLLRRAAAMIEAVVSGMPEPEPVSLPPTAEPVTDVREG
jgi:hypothetical protein